MAKVIANCPMQYKGKRYRAGEVFDMRDKDARLFVVLQRVDIYTEPPPAPPAPEAPPPRARRVRKNPEASAPVEPEQPVVEESAPPAPVVEAAVENAEPAEAPQAPEAPIADAGVPVAAQDGTYQRRDLRAEE